MAEDKIRSLLERNNVASQKWHAMPTIEDMKTMGDRKATIIVTCADPRADPGMYFGLNPGEAPTIRNAGGRVTEDVLTSLELMGSVMKIGTLLLIHHTDCGGLYMSNDAIRSKLNETHPQNADLIADKTWYSYHNIGMDQSIRDDVAALKSWRFLPEATTIKGFVFDIKTGKLREVV